MDANGANTTVQSWIASAHTARLIDFTIEVFGAVEISRVPTEDGGIGHAELRIGDTWLLAFDSRPDWPPLPALLRVWVDDADATMAAALGAGARVVTPLSDSAFGQRGGRVRDPLGNIWWITQHVEDVPPDVMIRRLREPAYAESMRVAQETLDRELSGRETAWSSPPAL
ncbi:MAG TPA: VOC family protein [Nocardioides sp.]|uniref:VOC family protein n=1 Tax=Nocardioides sp. TaxID=35761 RepID=UPI002E37D156|nr:VOC family protein [Nocardioides sp.]HEX5087131.1 VOC family protein [Nocardioides sp.]